MRNAFIKLPIEVSYIAEVADDCDDCEEQAEKLGLTVDQVCPECAERKTTESHAGIRTVYIPIDDIKEIIKISDTQLQLERFTDPLKVLVELSEEEFDKKLREVADLV